MLFKQVIGHDSLKAKLIQSVSEGRIPHAQLFAGSEGSGHLPLAIAYAQYLNCTQRQPGDSCGICPSCLMFEKLAHPDLHFIYPVASTTEVKEKPRSVDFIQAWRTLLLGKQAYINLPQWYDTIGIEKKQGIISVHDCNEIVRTLGYTSYEGNYKVMIIWMAEKLFHAAAPKILKILEEPPDKTVFILVSAQTDQILPTILSRTQLVKVPKIDDNSIASFLLTQYPDKSEEIRDCVHFANGDLIMAIDYMESSDDEEVQFTPFRNWMLLCYQKKTGDLMKFIDETSKYSRESLKHFLFYGLGVFRYCQQLHVLPDPDIKMDGKELEFVKNFSKYVHPGNTAALYQVFNDAIYHIERNAHAGILLLDLSLQVHQLLRIPKPQNFS